MFGNNFIKAIEIWQPANDSQSLELADCYYEKADEFGATSKNLQFRYNEDLVGRAWAEGRPLICQDLKAEFFSRWDVAQGANFSCVVAVPIFAVDSIKSVLLLFCGGSEEQGGAIEIWHKPHGSNEIGCADGYFRTDEQFIEDTQKVKFMRGFGIAGIVWGTQLPFIMTNLGRNKRFVRSASALRNGLVRGIGMPCGRKTDDETWVLTLLSSVKSPIAGRFEYWIPQEEGLMFSNGVCAYETGLSDAYRDLTLSLNEGTMVDVWKRGIPALSTNLADEPEAIAVSTRSAGLSMKVALPVFWGEQVSAVAAWYL